MTPIPDWSAERIDLREWDAAPYNPRAISDEARDGLTESLRRFGLVQPIVVNRVTGHIVGGNQRASILLERGEPVTTAIVVELEERDEKALNVALNSEHIAGEWTDEALALLREVEASRPDLAAATLLPQLRADLDAHFAAQRAPEHVASDREQAPCGDGDGAGEAPVHTCPSCGLAWAKA